MSYMSKILKQKKKVDITSTFMEAYEITKENITSKLNSNKKLQEDIISSLASYMKVKLYEAEEFNAEENLEDNELDNNNFDDNILSDEVKDDLQDVASQLVASSDDTDTTLKEDEVPLNIPDDVIKSYVKDNFPNDTANFSEITKDWQKFPIEGAFKPQTNLSNISPEEYIRKANAQVGIWQQIKDLASSTGNKAAEMGHKLIDYIKTNPGVAAGYAIGAAGLIFLIKSILSKKKEKNMQESFNKTLLTLKNINDALDEMNNSNKVEVVKYIAESLYRNLY